MTLGEGLMRAGAALAVLAIAATLGGGAVVLAREAHEAARERNWLHVAVISIVLVSGLALVLMLAGWMLGGVREC